MKIINKDTITALATIIISVISGIAALSYSIESSYFPLALIVFMLILSTLLLIRKIDSPTDKTEGLEAEDVKQIKAAALVFGSIVFYVLLTKLVNYEIATFIFLCATIWTLGYQKPIKVIVISFAFTASLYAIFFELLAVARPESYLFY